VLGHPPLVMARTTPNPLHWDQRFARDSSFGGIIRPQSIAVALDFWHGASRPAGAHIPGSHLILRRRGVGFYGVPVRPRRPAVPGPLVSRLQGDGTKFAGRRMFSRGDTVHRTSTPLVARERSTAIRYLYDEAKKARDVREPAREVQAWTNAELIEVEKLRREWLGVQPDGRLHPISTSQGRRHAARAGCRAAHLASFSPPIPGLPCSTSGHLRMGRPPASTTRGIYQDPGWGDEFRFDEEDAMIDPRKRDGLLRRAVGAATSTPTGQLRSAWPAAYGYGATMGAWCTDYLPTGQVNDGIVRHTKATSRTGVRGDVHLLRRRGGRQAARHGVGVPLVQVKLRLTNQNGETLVTCTAEVELAGLAMDLAAAPIAFARIRPAAERRAGAGCTDAARFPAARSRWPTPTGEALAFPTPDGVLRWTYGRIVGTPPSRWRRHCARAG